MANLTLTTKTLKDGAGADVTTQLYADPNRAGALGPVTAVVLADGTVLALGQALAAASLPVVLPAAQQAALAAPVLAAGTSVVGKVGIDQTTPGTTNGVAVQAVAAGGATPYSYVAAASSNQDSQVVKASAGQVYGWQLFNPSAAARYVKVYDKATGPTSADTPVKRFFLPAGGGAIVPTLAGSVFAAGIAFRITTGVADNDAAAATAGDVLVNCDYK